MFLSIFLVDSDIQGFREFLHAQLNDVYKKNLNNY